MSTPSNEELTQRMEIERELYIRMEAFIQRWSEEVIVNLLQSSQVIAEAKALRADLPNPVDPIDPDLKVATTIAMENAPSDFPMDTYTLVDWVLKGIKAGRSLSDQENAA